MKLLVIIGISALLVAGATWYIVVRSTPAPVMPAAPITELPAGATVITLTPDGFEPAEVTVPVGTVIAFRTTANMLFWPASNLHPSHTIYPEFDPLGPIEPTAFWLFTFNEVGDWKYHDHLAPYFTGVIHVTQ